MRHVQQVLDAKMRMAHHVCMSDLNAFLAKYAIRQRDFADRLNVDQATVSRLARRVMRPSLELAVSIERETNGEVPAASWIAPLPQSERAAN